MTTTPPPDLWPVIAPHAGHRIVLVPFGFMGFVTRAVLWCETCDTELADLDVTTGEDIA